MLNSEYRCYKNELPQFILHKMILQHNHFSLNPEP